LSSTRTSASTRAAPEPWRSDSRGA
jgi:hypothetical protein